MSDYFLLDLDDQASLDKFQELANTTAVYPDQYSAYGRMYAALGLAGEAGEIADETSKHWRNDGGHMTSERGDKIMDELGDAMWFVAALCTEWQLSLSEVCEHILQKLQEREREGNLKHE
jgi:NTP pyrophosphatase (non-canonical NTP hydrolase)